MLRAIIFDFDGVITDSEPSHLAMFQVALGELGIFLSRDEYYARYVGCDDAACFQAVLASRGRAATAADIGRLVDRKARLFSDHRETRPLLYPGVRELVQEAVPQYHLAVASGALRREIEYVLDRTGLRKDFAHITAAEDVRRGKPAPDPFLHALHGLNQLAPVGTDSIDASDCLVIEDSLPGLEAARSAGMKVLAVASTHRLGDLAEADWRVPALSEVVLPELARTLWSTA